MFHEYCHLPDRDNHLENKDPKRRIGWLMPLRAKVVAHFVALLSATPAKDAGARRPV
jgi:hypothetical protein